MYFLYSFLSVLSVLFLLIPGFILRKFKFLSDVAAKDMSSVLLYVGIPALTFHCMMGVDINTVKPMYILLSTIMAIVVHFISFGVAKIFYRGDNEKQQKATAIFTSIFSNCGFLGIPLAEMAINNCAELSAVANETVQEVLFYVSIYNIVFNILAWSLGLFISSCGENKKTVLKIALLNPTTISTIICLPFFLTGFSLLKPIMIGNVSISLFGDIIEFFYSLCVPLSMIILGTRLADVSFKDLLTSKYGYISSAIKLIITPLLTFGIMMIIDIFYKLDIAFIVAFVVMSGMPAATNALAFAERYTGDSKIASIAILLSTLLLVVTLPLLLLMSVSIYLGV